MHRYANGGLPELRLVDPNHKGQGIFLIQHKWIGVELEPRYTSSVLCSISRLWKNDVVLASKDRDGNEIVYVAYGPDENEVVSMTREEYEKS